MGGCDKVAPNNDLVNKSEYSVLQHYEYELRNTQHDKTYMAFNNALGTKLTVLAFPIKNKPTGYVVILANSKSTPTVKTMTESEFLVTKEAYIALKKELNLSNEVDNFIAERVQ